MSPLTLLELTFRCDTIVSCLSC